MLGTAASIPEYAVVLLSLTSPGWAGPLAGGLAVRYMPRLQVVLGLSIGLCIGALAWIITAVLTVMLFAYDLPMPPYNADWWGSPILYPVWFVSPASSALATACICWRMSRNGQQAA